AAVVQTRYQFDTGSADRSARRAAIWPAASPGIVPAEKSVRLPGRSARDWEARRRKTILAARQTPASCRVIAQSRLQPPVSRRALPLQVHAWKPPRRKAWKGEG